MKCHVKRITSATLLVSILLSAASSSALPAMASEAETAGMAAVETEEDIQTAVESEIEETGVTEVSGNENEAVEGSGTEDNTTMPEKMTEQPEVKFDSGDDLEKQEKETASSGESEFKEPGEESSEESKAAGPVIVNLELEPAEATPEYMDPKQAGLSQELKLSAVNPTGSSAELRIYFWDYSGGKTEGKKIPDEVLTEPCGEAAFPFCDGNLGFPVTLTGEDGNETYGTFCLQEEMEGGQLSARYLKTEIPAGYTLSDSFPVSNDLAETVVVSAAVYPEEMAMEYDKCVITWNERTADSGNDETGQEAESEQLEIGQAETGQVETGQAETGLAETELSEIPGGSIPENLNAEDFSSCRLLVMVQDETKILESDHVIGSYEDLYLIEYETAEMCMAAYAYYIGVADAVEPDAVMEIASDTQEGEPEDFSPEVDNPVTALSNTEGASFLQDGTTRVIALLDTGASASENVVDRVSLIDDALEGHSHGNAMVSAITEQNPDAQILSVRVMGNDGRGTVSAIVAGMEYAMEHGADIINLSLSSKKEPDECGAGSRDTESGSYGNHSGWCRREQWR